MQQHQYSLQLIQHSANGSVIGQRSSDGYINATALCLAAEKRFNDYSKLVSTQAFLTVVSSKTGIPVINAKQGLIESRVGSPESGGGSWVHPKVAIHLGQWLSPEFAYQVSEWVEDWMSGKGAQNMPAQLPAHLARYLKNDVQVPQGYFSVLQETALNLFGPLHNLGFEIPRGWVPDISVGKLYCTWLREQHGLDTDALPTYPHDYLDSRPIVFPKAYPEEYLADFRNWFRKVWLPVYGVQYFKRKDPSSLSYLDRLPALAAPSQSTSFLPNWRKTKKKAA